MPLVIDKPFDVMFFGETFNHPFAMLVYTSHKVVRDADIKRPAWPARKNVDPKASRETAAWIAGSSPAMTN
jgi:hypothetical protein